MEETTNWFTEHGIPIIIVLVASLIGYQILKIIIHRAMRGIVSARGKKRRAKEELEKRSDTLTGYISTAVGAIVLVIAIFMILSEVGVDIAPLIAGAGVVGIAIGFGAQSLIKDYLNGLLTAFSSSSRISITRVMSPRLPVSPAWWRVSV